MNARNIQPFFISNTIIDAHSADEIEHALKSEWQATSFQPKNSGRNFHAIAWKCKLDRVSLGFGYYNSGSETHFNGMPFVRQLFALADRGTITLHRKELIQDNSNSCVLVPNSETIFKFKTANQHIIARIDPAILEASFTALTGALPRGGYSSEQPLRAARISNNCAAACCCSRMKQAGQKHHPSCSKNLKTRFLRRSCLETSITIAINWILNRNRLSLG